MCSQRTTSLNSFNTRADVRAVITSKVEFGRCQTVMPKLAEVPALKKVTQALSLSHTLRTRPRAAVDPHRPT